MPRKRAVDPRYGARLAEIRQSRCLSQARLAKRIGVTPGAVQTWEHGRASLTVDRLLQLAHALKCEPADFLED
jgi:transcriptional regulator with XRE-family HTH domain